MMVHAGNFQPNSDMTSSSRPDAFLYVDQSATSEQKKFKWIDLTCPMEYKFGKGNQTDVSEPSLPLTLIGPSLFYITSFTEQREDLVEP